jgi:hypothetical protein
MRHWAERTRSRKTSSKIILFPTRGSGYPGSPARQAGPTGCHPRLNHVLFGCQISNIPRFFYPCRVFLHRSIEGSEIFLSRTARRMWSFILRISGGLASAAELCLYMNIRIVDGLAPLQAKSLQNRRNALRAKEIKSFSDGLKAMIPGIGLPSENMNKIGTLRKPSPSKKISHIPISNLTCPGLGLYSCLSSTFHIRSMAMFRSVFSFGKRKTRAKGGFEVFLAVKLLRTPAPLMPLK